MEQQGSPCLCRISLRIDISVPKTAREVNSCWILSSISLLLFFWCSGSTVAKRTWTLEAQIYLIPWFAISPHLSRWVLWLYSTYVFHAYVELPFLLSFFILLPIRHPFSLCVMYLFSLMLPLLYPVSAWAAFQHSVQCITHMHTHTHAHTNCPPAPFPPKKRNRRWGQIQPFGSGTSPNKISVSAAWSNHRTVCPH